MYGLNMYLTVFESKTVSPHLLSLLSLQSICFEARQLCGAPGVDPVGHDPPHPGLLSVQPPQSGSGDQTDAQIGATLTASLAAPLGHTQ